MAGKEPPQSGDELAAEDPAEHLDGQEEVRGRRYPACMIRRQSATGNDAVDVRMWNEGLSPGVQDGEQASLSAEMLRIGCDFQQRGGACFEQQSEEPPLVLPHERHKHMWNAEDQVV